MYMVAWGYAEVGFAIITTANYQKQEEKVMEERIKSANADLSEIRRQASQSRKVHRGGRPKGYRRDNIRPPSTIGVDPLDAAVLRNYAAMRGFTIRRVLHLLSAALVLGADKIPARPNLAPAGWAFADK